MRLPELTIAHNTLMVPMLVLVLELGLVLGRVLQLAAAARGNGEQVTKGAAEKSARARALEEEKIKLQIRAADGSGR